MQTVLAAKGVVTDGTHVLLIRRHPNDSHRPGQWDIPGGAVEPGERLEDAAARETFEEAGVHVDAKDLTLVFTTTRADGDRNLVRFDFLVRVASQPAITLSNEHTEWCWLTFDEAIATVEHDRLRQALTFVRDNILQRKTPARPVAKALVLDDAGNALLLTRSATHPTLPLQPDVPGGELEPGELPAAALVREIAEETGLKVDIQNVRMLYAEAEVQDGVDFVRTLFVARVASVRPDVKLSWEHSEFAWVSVDDVPDLEEQFNSFAKHALAYVRAHNLLETA